MLVSFIQASNIAKIAISEVVEYACAFTVCFIVYKRPARPVSFLSPHYACRSIMCLLIFFVAFSVWLLLWFLRGLQVLKCAHECIRATWRPHTSILKVFFQQKISRMHDFFSIVVL